MPTVLAIDPGSAKCGVAVVSDGPRVLHKSVVSTSELSGAVARLVHEHSPSVILVGNGTSAKAAAESVEARDVPIEFVDETFTSILARKRYFRENPPRGLRMLIPTSMQTPPCPIDDYVAVILAERYLSTSV